MPAEQMRTRIRWRRQGPAAALAAILAGSAFLAPAPALATDPEPAPARAGAKALAPERAAIESVLSEMKRAVLAGDAPAYLAHVIPADGTAGDPIFRKEQENWAKDLKDHVPVEFDIAIAESDDPAEHPARFTPSRAEFDLKMTWRMPGKDGAPARRARSITLPVVFVNPGNAGWQYAGENWKVLEGEPDAAVRAKYLPGGEKVARAAVEAMAEVRKHVEEGFEEKIPRVQEIKVYSGPAAMRHLQESIYLSYIDPLGGWNEPGESIKVLASEAGAGIKALLGHEFGHVATFDYGPKATDMPWWILEGVAELSSQDFRPGLWQQTDELVRSWAKSGQLAKWEDITDFRKTDSKWHIHVYRQGQHMVGYISNRFGRAGRNAWLRAMAAGATLDEATQQAFKMSFTELDRQWRQDLTAPANRARPPNPDADADDGRP